MADNGAKKFNFTLNEHSVRKFQEHFSVEIWCDGRDYNPSTEAYHPRYSYKITANEGEWEYIDNDIHGAANEVPDLLSGAKSLFAFLLARKACQKTLTASVKTRTYFPHMSGNSRTISKNKSN